MIGSIAAQLMLYHFRPWLDHTNIVEVNFSAILCSDDYSSVQIMEHVLKANLINGKCYISLRTSYYSKQVSTEVWVMSLTETVTYTKQRLNYAYY